MQKLAHLATRPCRYCQRPTKWLKGQTAERPEPHWIILELDGKVHACQAFTRIRALTRA